MCVNRFDDETKQAFLELYDKVDADFQLPNEEVAPEAPFWYNDLWLTSGHFFMMN